MAAPEDYSPDNPGWQGTSKLFDMARVLGFGVQVRSALDWRSLGDNDILLVVYPMSQLQAKHLSAWLRGGGRAIIADDFGSAGPLLESLGVRRFRPDGQSIQQLHAENPSLPLATPGISHPLNVGISHLVTNHPSAFDTELPSIFRFEPRQGAVVVAATLGKGRIVLVSDPSVLINRMLEFEGNQTFARRLLTYLGRAGEDRYVVLIQAFDEVGAPKAPVKVHTPPDQGLAGILADANSLLGEFNEYVLDRLWIMPLATLLAGLLLAMAVWLIPMLRPVYDASWTRPGEGPPPTRYALDLAPYLTGHRRKLNYIYPAAVLRDVLDADLEKALRVTAPLSTMDEHGLRDLVKRRAGAQGEQICSRLIQITRRIPDREQVGPWTLTPRYTLNDLERLRDTGEALLAAVVRPGDQHGGPNPNSGPNPSER